MRASSPSRITKGQLCAFIESDCPHIAVERVRIRNLHALKERRIMITVNTMKKAINVNDT